MRTAHKRRRPEEEEEMKTPSQAARDHADALSGKRTAQGKGHMSDFSDAMAPGSPYSEAVLRVSSGGEALSTHRQALLHALSLPAMAPLRCCDETAATALRRVGGRPLRTGIHELDRLLGAGLSYPSMLEVTGASASGKTEIMLNMCGECTLPDSHLGVYVGGNEASVLYMCLGSVPTHNITRLVTLYDMQARKVLLDTGRDMGEDLEEWIASFVMGCLSRVHFVVCENSLELFAAVLSTGRLQQSSPGLKAVVIDSISAFQWFDKTERECKINGNGTCRMMDSAFAALQRVCEKHNLVLFVTRWASGKQKEDSAGGVRFGSVATDLVTHKWGEMATVQVFLETRPSARGRPEYFGQVKQKGGAAKGWGNPTSIPLTTLTQQLTRTLNGR